MTIYVATENAGKLAEFAASASGAGVVVLALPGLDGMPEPVEDAATFMGNAELKARYYSRALAENPHLKSEMWGTQILGGLFVMADDSGLCVDAIGGEPGVRSARYAEDAAVMGAEPAHDDETVMNGAPLVWPGTKDERNNAYLLERMRGVAERGARFVCALAVARDGEVVWRAEGVCVGELLGRGRGREGFGYDPLFLLPEMGRTMAELGRGEKWLVSHRGKAFRELLRVMKEVGPGG